MLKLEMRLSKLTIRLTDSERTDLRTTAKKFRLSESEYGRKMMLGKGEIKQIVIPELNQNTRQELGRLRLELNRQGINLNQIVKLANSQHQVPVEVNNQLATLIELYKQLQASIISCQSQLVKLYEYDREN